MSASAPSAEYLPSLSNAGAAAASGEQARVLLVDDDANVGVVLGGWLNCKGYAVTHATGPQQADERLAETTFDLVISDIHMPGNERLEWIEQLLQRGCSAAIVLLTGNPEFATACRAANLSVAGYLVKPPNFQVVEELLGRIVEEKRQRGNFLALAHELLELLSARGANGLGEEHALAERLAELARCFALRPAVVKREDDAASAGEERWHAVIEDTIAVIEKTKDSFRSKELGRLRLRLERLLPGSNSADAACAAKKSKVEVWCADAGEALRCAPCATA